MGTSGNLASVLYCELTLPFSHKLEGREWRGEGWYFCKPKCLTNFFGMHWLMAFLFAIHVICD